MDIMEHRSLWTKIKHFVKYRILRIKEPKYDGWCMEWKAVRIEEDKEVIIHIGY